MEDQGYLGLPSGFIANQITIAKEYAAHQLANKKNWPPSAFFQRKFSALEVERLGVGEIPAMASAPAAYRHGHSQLKADLQELKLLMLPGDELWLFSNGSEAWKAMSGVAGVALVRDGLAVENIITARN